MSLATIPFTQFLRPHGERRQVGIARPTEIAEKAEIVRSRGFSFEIEELTNGLISMEVLNRTTEVVLANEVCTNGPDVPIRVDKMVNDAFAALGGVA